MMDLKLIKIKDARTDNERVVLKVLSKCNINSYILFDTTYDESGIVSNKHRHIFIFPDLVVAEGDFIWLYTKMVLMVLIKIPVEQILIKFIGDSKITYGIMRVIKLI